MSSQKYNKSGIVNLLTAGGNNPKFVPPVLRDVGKLAAGVAAVNTTTTQGSATGNPRNKCALQPGHSLMDWIRLGASGKDLTGVGNHAGHLEITPTELLKHNKLSDAWLAIRGRVYNVTSYLPFHPGGPEELMKGVGKDSTNLFDQVHPWVNYESILQKCLIGRLVLLSPSINQEELFLIKPSTTSSSQSINQNLIEEVKLKTNDENLLKNEEILPKFDWIQKMNEICLIFYTEPLINQLIEIKKIDNIINIILIYSNRTFINELVFFKDTMWPCDIKVNYETGKIECIFKKIQGCIWNNYGVLKQNSKITGQFSKQKFNYRVSNKIQIANDIFLIELDRLENEILIVPLGYHVRIFLDTDDISRSYTPIPSSLLTQIGQQKFNTDRICLMVKTYTNGKISKYICDKNIGDSIKLSKPIYGGFDLRDIEKKDNFLLLAAGTGITPMLSIIIFLLERRIRKSQSIRLIFCNKNLNSIPFKKQFDELSIKDSRFVIEHILSEPEKDWYGNKRHITKDFIKNIIDEQLLLTNYPKLDLYSFICGPEAFNQLTYGILKELDLVNEQICIFQG